MTRIARFETALGSVYFFVCVVVPLSCLILDYGTQVGLRIAGLYRHLFLYPALFGWLMFMLSATVVREMWRLTPGRRVRASWLVTWLLVVIAGMYLELTRPGAGFYEVSLKYLQDTNLRDPEGKMCSKTLEEYLLKPGAQPNEKDYSESAQEARALAGRYAVAAREVLPKSSLDLAYASATKFVVYIAVTILLGTFVAILFAFTRALWLFLHEDLAYLAVRARLLAPMLWAAMLSFPFFSMRRAFEIERDLLLGPSNSQFQVIVLPFLAASAYLTYMAWNDLGQKAASVFGLLATLGITALAFSEGWERRLFPDVVSVGSALSHYGLLALVVVGTVAPLVISLLERLREPHTDT